MTLDHKVDEAKTFIDKLVEFVIIVSIGHTSKYNELIKKAIDAGAKCSTQLGNGTFSELHKNENQIMEQLGEDRLSANYIADEHTFYQKF